MRCVLTAIVLALTCINLQADGSLQLPEEDFERLFTYPQSRTFLDKNRHLSADQLVLKSPTSVEAVPITTKRSQQLSVDGFIISESGRHTVWLDEGLGPESTVSRSYKPNAKSKKVPVRSSGGTRFLKPGQVWLLGENKVEEQFNLNIENEILLQNVTAESSQSEETSEAENASSE